MQSTRHYASHPGSNHLPIRRLTRWFASLVQSHRWNDYGAAFAGLRAMVRHSQTPDPIKLALSVFSADSLVVSEGRLARYRLNLADSGTRPRWLKLVIDIYFEENPVHPEGHFGYFDKEIMIRPLKDQDVQIGFDWQERAAFTIEGVNFPADRIWWGPCRTPGIYSVRACAIGEQGQTLDQLEVHQKLMP